MTTWVVGSVRGGRVRITVWVVCPHLDTVPGLPFYVPVTGLQTSGVGVIGTPPSRKSYFGPCPAYAMWTMARPHHWAIMEPTREVKGKPEMFMDYERARHKALLHRFIGAVIRRCGSTLASLAEAKRGYAYAGQAHGGMQQIPIDRIVG